MNETRIKRKTYRIAGSIKDGDRQGHGDREIQPEGALEKRGGQAQVAAGKATDNVKNATHRATEQLRDAAGR